MFIAFGILTPKGPRIFWCKITQNYPLLIKELVTLFDKYFSRSNHMIKYKTYIYSIGRSFIFYFISTLDIIMLKVAVFVFFSMPRELVSNSALDYKEWKLKLLFNMM
jgi:hypothetical protein